MKCGSLPTNPYLPNSFQNRDPIRLVDGEMYWEKVVDDIYIPGEK